MEETLGQKIKRARTTKGLMQKELGYAVGRTESWVAKLEKDHIDRPRGDVLAKLATILELPELTPVELRLEGLLNAAGYDIRVSGIDDRTRELAEIGARVVSMVEQRRNIVPGPLIRTAPVAVRIPVVNNLSAAELASDIRQVETWIELPASLLKGAKDPVAFIVVGDCLQERWGIRTGDTLIVDAANKDPRDGEIVAALIDDQDRTAKEFYRVADGVDLRPTTSGYSTIEIRGETQLIIIGVYVTFLPTGDR